MPDGCNSTVFLARRYIDESSSSIFMDLLLGEDPQGPNGIEWLRRARKLVKEETVSSPYSLLVAGGLTYNYDSVQV